MGIIDSNHAGSNINQEYTIDRDIPIYKKLDHVIDQGAEVLILGIAPSGGKIPDTWHSVIKEALNSGLSIINGLHDCLGPSFSLSKYKTPLNGYGMSGSLNLPPKLLLVVQQN